MADETRLHLLETLSAGEKCVTGLVEELKLPQRHVTHHLRILRETGLVEGRRNGKQGCYRISSRVRGALALRQGRALDFGCCELRSPESACLLQAAHAEGAQRPLAFLHETP